jgi:hypothetical protein
MSKMKCGIRITVAKRAIEGVSARSALCHLIVSGGIHHVPWNAVATKRLRSPDFAVTSAERATGYIG